MNPTILIVTRISGAGKNTIAAMLAGRLGWSFADAGDFHPVSNIAKMLSGQPLNDLDRLPWLHAVARQIDSW